MSLRQLAHFTASVVLLAACGSTPQPKRPPSPPLPAASDYVTITPDESTYPARTAYQEPAPVAENDDIMAGILAIPPGR